MNSNQTEIYEFWGYNYDNITIPKSVVTIRESAFENSTLTSIIFEEDSNLTSIHDYAFRNCSNLVTIELPESVKNIHESAFSGCQLLKNLTFLGPIENIEDNMFINCNNLEFVIFPKSSMIVNCNSFCTNNCPKFMSFTHKTLFSLGSIDIITNVLISYFDEQNLIITTNTIIMNSNQTEIYEFWGYDYNNITIPKSVIAIRENAFENSTLTKIIFEEDSNLHSIQSSAFRNCSFITTINITSLNISIIYIFCFKDCINLTSICLSASNLIILNNAFENCFKLEKVNGIFSIPEFCFSGCNSLKEVNIHHGSKYIGYKSFEHCYSLESIHIPSSVRVISDYSFIDCKKLTSIIFEATNSLERIFINSFSGCESLSSLRVPYNDNVNITKLTLLELE